MVVWLYVGKLVSGRRYREIRFSGRLLRKNLHLRLQLRLSFESFEAVGDFERR